MFELATILLFPMLLLGCSPSPKNTPPNDINQYEKERTEEMAPIKKKLDSVDSLLEELGQHNETVDKLKEILYADTIR